MSSTQIRITDDANQRSITVANPPSASVKPQINAVIDFFLRNRRVDTVVTSPLQVNRHKKVHASINIISIKQQKQAMTITPKISRGLRVLQPPKKEDVQAEKDELMKEIALIEQWWREPRWKGTTRTYSGQIFLMFDVLDVDDGCMLL